VCTSLPRRSGMRTVASNDEVQKVMPSLISSTCCIGPAMPRSLFTHTLFLLLVARACTAMSIQGHSTVRGTSLSCCCSSSLLEVADCPQVRQCRGKSIYFSLTYHPQPVFVLWVLHGLPGFDNRFRH